MTGEERPKERPLFRMFNAVPPRYDTVNRIFTWGLDERWRKQAARICLESHPARVMDLCCGTGDLAVWLASMAQAPAPVCGLDYSRPMLARAVEKAQRRPVRTPLTFVQGDVADLPFPDACFDAIGISFAFRNLTYKNPLTRRYLQEVVRVLKPGGRFVIVESSQPPNAVIRKLFHAYVRWYVPRVGHLISKNRPAYRYLSESAARFYTAEELADLLAAAGFGMVTVKRLLFGAAAIHVATR